MDESTRRQINWVITIGALACLIVWGSGRSGHMDRLQEQLAIGSPAQQVRVVQELVRSRALAEALKDQPRWVQDRAIAAAAQIATPQAWHQLLTAYNFLDAPVQARVNQILKEAGNSAIITLVEALKNKDANTRAGVNPALIAIGEPAVPYVLPLLSAWDDFVRAGASAVLGGIGEPALGDVLALAHKTGPSGEQDSDAYLRERAAVQTALKAMKATAIPGIVTELLNASNTDTRSVGASLLGSIADQSVAAPIAEESAVEVIAPLIDRLKNDPSYAVRRQAALSLGRLGAVGRAHGTAAPLIATLQDTGQHSEVRGAATEALGRLGDPAAAAPLINALLHSRTGISNQLANALERLGPAAVPALTTAIVGGDSEAQLLAIRALSNIAAPSVVPPLARAVNATDAMVRRAASEALRAQSSANLAAHVAETSAPLARALHDADWRVYYAARDALAKSGPAAIPALMEALGNPEARVAHMAQEALVRIGKPSIPALIDAIRQAPSNPAKSDWAAVALGLLGADAFAQLAQLASTPQESLPARIAAVAALGKTRNPKAITTLQGVYADQYPDLCIAIVHAVSNVASAEGVDLLVKALQASSPTVRDAAMETLANWRTGHPREQLVKLLDSPDTDLKYRAAVALVFESESVVQTTDGQTGAASEVQVSDQHLSTVTKLLTTAAGDKGASTLVRHYAIRGLGRLGDAEGVAVLGQLIKAGGEFARDAAESVALIGVKSMAQDDDRDSSTELSPAGQLLIGILTDPASRDDIIMQAAIALSMMDASPVRALVEELQKVPDNRKPWIAATIGAIGRHATEHVLETRNRSQDADYRMWLAVTMQSIGDDRSLKAIKHMHEQEKPDPTKAAYAQQLTDKIRLQKK